MAVGYLLENQGHFLNGKKTPQFIVEESIYETLPSDEIEMDGSQPLIDLTISWSDGELRKRSGVLFQIKRMIFDSLDKHPDEHRFVMKLDFFFLSSAMLGYFIKSLNATNISTAYVNGMNEYYEMESNQYNTLQALWTFGYVIGQIPSNLILHKVSARYYLGGLEIIWSLLTFAMIYCESLAPLYLIRFLVGLTESGFFPAMEYLIGSWYSPSEICKRSSLLSISGVAAKMLSGPLQQWVLTGVAESSTEFQAFQWLFIVDSMISLPVAFYTMVFNPNTPSTTAAIYFSDKDKLIAQERRRRIGAELNGREDYTLTKIRSFFKTWHIWVFPLVFLAFNNCGAAIGQPTFTTWMKYDLKLSPLQYNTYPTAISGLGIAFALVISWISDWTNNRLNVFFVNLYFICLITGCALLAYWDIPLWLHWFCYFLIGVPGSWGQPQIFSWVNKLLRYDDMKRNFVVVCTNTLAYVTGAWVPIIVWDTRDQPKYHTGFTYTTFLAIFGLVLTTTANHFSNRDKDQGLYYEGEKSIILKRSSSNGSVDAEDVRSLSPSEQELIPLSEYR